VIPSLPVYADITFDAATNSLLLSDNGLGRTLTSQSFQQENFDVWLVCNCVKKYNDASPELPLGDGSYTGDF